MQPRWLRPQPACTCFVSRTPISSFWWPIWETVYIFLDFVGDAVQLGRFLDDELDLLLVLEHLLDVLGHDFLEAAELAHQDIFVILDLAAVVEGLSIVVDLRSGSYRCPRSWHSCRSLGRSRSARACTSPETSCEYPAGRRRRPCSWSPQRPCRRIASRRPWARGSCT